MANCVSSSGYFHLRKIVQPIELRITFTVGVAEKIFMYTGELVRNFRTKTNLFYFFNYSLLRFTAFTIL